MSDPKPLPKLPPFKSLLKAPEVEDPLHRYLNRPLAYAFVWAVYRTRLTPNQVTFAGLVIGIASGMVFLVGTPWAMVAGGLMFWASSILDDADGMLARAKNMFSELGRAFDGSADMIVGIFTVIPAFYHLWVKHHDPVQLAFMVPAILSAIVHFNLCDFYRVHYLRIAKRKSGGASIEKDLAEVKQRPWHVRFALLSIFLPYLNMQRATVRLTNPVMLDLRLNENEEAAAIWKARNAGPMRLWAMISHAPHNHLMAICAVTDRLDIYLWVRVVAMNVLFAIVVIWQRRATRRTLQELSLLPRSEPAVQQV